MNDILRLIKNGIKESEYVIHQVHNQKNKPDIVDYMLLAYEHNGLSWLYRVMKNDKKVDYHSGMYIKYREIVLRSNELSDNEKMDFNKVFDKR